MRILYVSQYFPPEMGAPSARVSELARHWARAGHEVTVLTGFPNHPTGVMPAAYRGRLREMVIRERVEGYSVVRTWLIPLPNRKTYERLLNYSSFCISAAATGTFLKKPDVVVATSPQLLVGLSGWWIGRVHRVPFVFEVRDLWPESLEAVGVAGKTSPMVRLLRSVAGFLYRKATHIVVVTAAFQEHLIERWHVPPERISIVENGVEAEFFTPGADGTAFRAAHGLQGKFVVSYIGTFGNAHGLPTILNSARNLAGRIPDLRFVLVGEGAEKQAFERELARSGVRNVIVLPQQPRETIPAVLCASDVSLVLLRKAELFKTVIPTKMLEAMSCARPVVLGVEGAARELVEKAGAGVCIEPENDRQLSAAIEQLHRDPELRARMGNSGRQFILERCSRPQQAEEYHKLLSSVVRGGR